MMMMKTRQPLNLIINLVKESTYSSCSLLAFLNDHYSSHLDKILDATIFSLSQ